MSLWRGERVLVTGGASFIGSHLVEELVSRGARVRVADDLSSGTRSNLDSVAGAVEVLVGDLRSVEFARTAVKNVSRVFHLAADHGGRGYIAGHPANCVGNMALDYHVFSASCAANVEHITFASSACVYPTDVQDDPQLLTEDMVSFARRGGAFADEEYGWAKLMGELSLLAHVKQHNIAGASCRISTAYGPRENESHAVIALIAKVLIEQDPFEIWGDGEQSRGFTYVSDVVQGLIRASEVVTDGEAVNLGTDQFTSVNELSDAIMSAMAWRPSRGVRHLTDLPVGVKHRALDLTRARTTLAWEPQISLQQGLKETIESYVRANHPRDVAASLQRRLLTRGASLYMNSAHSSAPSSE